MVDVGTWMRQQGRVYFGNATTKRDLRVQLRGSKAILLWSVYLLVFVGIAIFAYASIAANDRKTSLSYAQSELRSFYEMVLALLAGIVCVIAPALGATAVVSERHRRSLDMVFTAPVTAKYYLVGKLLSTYRYIWMLLLLSLPVVSVGVVMGGATWGDVAKTYLIISLDALLYSAIALAISAGASKLTSSVIMSYAVVIPLAITSISASVPGIYMGSSRRMPVVALFSPFMAAETFNSTSTWFGTDVANLPLFCFFALAVLFLIVLGAGSALSSWHVRETSALRIIGLLLIAGAYVFLVTNVPASSTTSSYDMGMGFASGMLVLLPVIPFLTCYSKIDAAKFEYDGRSRFRNIFRAAPSGALPYALGMLASGIVGVSIGSAMGGMWPGPVESISFVVYVLGVYLFTWSVCRLSSRLTTTLAAARGLSTVFVALFFSVPSIFIGLANVYGQESPYEAFVPMAPFYVHSQPIIALVWGVLLAAFGGLIATAESRFKASQWKVERGVA